MLSSVVSCRKGGPDNLLSVEFKISDQKRKYLERMREIVELNYIQIDVYSFEIGDKKQLGIVLSIADNERRTDHDDDDDDDDDMMMMIMMMMIMMMIPKTMMIMRMM